MADIEFHEVTIPPTEVRLDTVVSVFIGDSDSEHQEAEESDSESWGGVPMFPTFEKQEEKEEERMKKDIDEGDKPKIEEVDEETEKQFTTGMFPDDSKEEELEKKEKGTASDEPKIEHEVGEVTHNEVHEKKGTQDAAVLILANSMEEEVEKKEEGTEDDAPKIEHVAAEEIHIEDEQAEEQQDDDPVLLAAKRCLSHRRVLIDVGAKLLLAECLWVDTGDAPFVLQGWPEEAGIEDFRDEARNRFDIPRLRPELAINGFDDSEFEAADSY